jgi:hypothetical protein
MSKLQTRQAVQDQLTAHRASLNEEIAAYPGPITGCDAQFNHLLERRAGLNAQLVLLTGMSEAVDAKTLEQFVEACPFLEGISGEKQK